MTRLRIRHLAAAAVGAAALVAVTALPADAKTSSPEKWGAAFCGGLTEWSDTITTGATEITTQVAAGSTPAQGKAVIVGFIGDMGDTTSEFYDTVKKAGNPDTTNGTKIQKEILKGIKGLEDGIGDLETQATALPIDSAASFQTAVQALVAGFDSVSVPFDTAMSKVARLDKGDALSDELQDVKECKALF